MMLGVYLGVKVTLSAEDFSDRLVLQYEVLETCRSRLYDLYGWDVDINMTRATHDDYIQSKQVLWSLLQSIVRDFVLRYVTSADRCTVAG